MRFYKNITEIKAAHKAIGHHFFSKGSRDAFNSIIYPRVYGGRYFITSEKDESQPRQYKVRKANDRGAISTASEYYPTKKQAEQKAIELAAQEEE